VQSNLFELIIIPFFKKSHAGKASVV